MACLENTACPECGNDEVTILKKEYDGDGDWELHECICDRCGCAWEWEMTRTITVHGTTFTPDE